MLAITDPSSITASEVALSEAGEVVAPGDQDAALAAITDLGTTNAKSMRYAANGPAFVAEHLLQDRCVQRFREVLNLADTDISVVAAAIVADDVVKPLFRTPVDQSRRAQEAV